MPWENVGSVDTGEMPNDEAWILFCLGRAKNYVQLYAACRRKKVNLKSCGASMRIGGSSISGCLTPYGEPCEYIRAYEDALDAFNKHVSWLDLKDFWRNQPNEEDEWEEDADED